jgi:uncharacterized protein YggE
MRAMNMMVLCVLTSAFVPAAARAQAPADPPRTITTNGEAVVYVAPDEVILNVGIETFDAQLERAKAQNDAAGQRLVSAVRELGVADKHVQTAQLEVAIHYKDRGGPIAGIDGYFARRSYSITLKKPDDFEKLVSTAIANGANQIHGFQFRTTELRKHRDQARSMAIKAAKEKAMALAGELDCRTGAPRTINDSGGWYGYYGWAGGNRFMSQNAIQDMGGGGGGTGGDVLPLGQIEVRASVQVSFDLIPGANHTGAAAPPDQRP